MKCFGLEQVEVDLIRVFWEKVRMLGPVLLSCQGLSDHDIAGKLNLTEV